MPNAHKSHLRQSYQSRRVDKKGTFRLLVCTKLRECHWDIVGAPLELVTIESIGELTGVKDAKMYWTACGFFKNIVVRHKLVLVGWPHGVIFQNLSWMTGGNPVLDQLLWKWRNGSLHFEAITDEQLKVLDAASAAPGCFIPPRPVVGRCDIKKSRLRPVTNPHNLPLRRLKLGPKTPVFLEESEDDIEDWPELDCGSSAGLGTGRFAEDTDPIEDVE
ncbi:uncharacterized protein FIBRA_09334 [Fibroporia radiculosa]|uniref:Uncharacterized protein n=1 Tax=Fibroporia radiculosa TaxID=599839 RepID=J7RVS6_9APHY|nr:uncharacterized protein FIBRA_09334 [Fibroporia radiculosa]CCM07015.1 predicted protein [Fibroporia radiculosa]